MTQKQSPSGLNTSQLYLMRMMLQQEKNQPLRTAPVQDIGGGLMQGVGNIVQALQERKKDSERNKMLQGYLQQEQAAMEQQQQQAQQVLQARASVLSQQYGMPADQALNTAMQPDAVFNKVVEGLQAIDADKRKPIVGGQTKTAEVLGEGAGKIKLNQIIGDQNVNTPQGQNMFRMINGFDPANTYTTGQQQNAFDKGTMENSVYKYQMPYLEQQPMLQNDKTIADTTGQRISNQYAPALNDATLTGKTTENGIQGINLQRQQQNQEIARLLQLGPMHGGITPQQAVQMWTVNSSNPIQDVTAVGGNKNLNGFGMNKPEGLVAPQAPAPQSSGSAPTTLLNLQPAGDTFHNYMSLSPQQQSDQAGAYRQQLMQNLGQAVSPIGQAIHSGFDNTYNTLQGGANLVFPSWLTGAGQQSPQLLNDPYAAPQGWFK